MPVVKQKPLGNRLQDEVRPGPEQGEPAALARAAISDLQRMVVERQIELVRNDPLWLCGSAGDDSLPSSFSVNLPLHEDRQPMRARRLRPQAAVPDGGELTRRQPRVGRGILPIEGDGFVDSRRCGRSLRGIRRDQSGAVGRFLIVLCAGSDDRETRWPNSKTSGSDSRKCIRIPHSDS